MALFWQRVIAPSLFVRVIDASVNFLFGWRCKNISEPQKLVSYQHLYSLTSVKTLVVGFIFCSFKRKQEESRKAGSRMLDRFPYARFYARVVSSFKSTDRHPFSCTNCSTGSRSSERVPFRCTTTSRLACPTPLTPRRLATLHTVSTRCRSAPRWLSSMAGPIHLSNSRC